MSRHHSLWLTSSALALVLSAACTSDDANPGSGGGGQAGSGGDSGGASAGGSAGTGGRAGNTGGGNNATGGGSNGTGGAGDGGPGSGGATTSDGSAGGSPATGGSSATGGVSSTGGAAATGGAAGDAAAACNSILNVGNDVSEQHVTSGSPPTMTGGGPVPDGTYMLIQRQDWQGSCNCTQRSTFSISGNVVHFVTSSDGAPDARISGTVAYSGNELTITFTCGAAPFLGQQMTMQYTVSSGGGQTIYKTYDTNGGKSQVETYLKVPPGGCTDLSSSQAVTSQAGVGTYPTPAGGTIADGTYLLSKYELYPPTAITPITRRGALRFSGSNIEAFEFNETSGFSTKGAGTIAIAGTNFTLTGTCPPGGGFAKPYTATANEFTWFETDGSNKFEIWTYTKQ